MADMMSAQDHYNAGMAELGRSAEIGETDPETSQACAQRAQGHFQAGLLSAVLDDLAHRDEPDASP
jgi:hypothetical protein